MTSKKATQSDLAALTAAINQFCAERDWHQFHNPKDMAVSIALEASELLEHFQWKTPDEIAAHVRDEQSAIREKVADILIFLLEFADICGIDPRAAVEAKIAKNATRYPVAKARGNHKKYTELNRG